MIRFLTLVVLVFMGVAAWKIGERLSADAVGLATGVVFGVLAGLPTAILVLASNRNRSTMAGGAERDRTQGPYGAYPYGGYPQQPPVIVLANGAHPALPPPEPSPTALERFDAARALQPPDEEPRRFRIIGDEGEVIEDDYITL